MKTNHYDLAKLSKEIKDIVTKTTAILSDSPGGPRVAERSFSPALQEVEKEA